MAILILSGACSGHQQEAVQAPSGTTAPGAGPIDKARWWCVDSEDAFSSRCERDRFDCERARERSTRPTGNCAPEPVAYCFRSVSKGMTTSNTVALDCSAVQSNCEDRRARAVERQLGARMLGECEPVE